MAKSLKDKAFVETIKRASKLLDNGIFVSPEKFEKIKLDILKTLKEKI